MFRAPSYIKGLSDNNVDGGNYIIFLFLRTLYLKRKNGTIIGSIRYPFVRLSRPFFSGTRTWTKLNLYQIFESLSILSSVYNRIYKLT